VGTPAAIAAAAAVAVGAGMMTPAEAQALQRHRRNCHPPGFAFHLDDSYPLSHRRHHEDKWQRAAASTPSRNPREYSVGKPKSLNIAALAHRGARGPATGAANFFPEIQPILIITAENDKEY
jgi:hypothetical protein